MAERNDEVLERVRQELGRQSDLGSRQLFEIAQEMDSSMAQMSLPQFHARYVLPIKREHAAQRSPDERTPRQPRKAARGGKRAAAARQLEAAAREEPARQEEPTRQEEPARQRQRAKTERKRRTVSAGTEAQAGQAAGAAGQPASQTQAAQSSQPGDRDRIRSVFLEFALEVAQAEGRVEMARILSRVDEYVDRVGG